MTSTKRLQILITAGAEDPHRARQGLEAACVAAAMGVEVRVFLTLRGAFWAEKRQFEHCVVPGCDSIPDLMGTLHEMGVLLECCSSCALQFGGTCETNDRLIDGVEMSGLASMVAVTADGTPTITF